MADNLMITFPILATIVIVAICQLGIYLLSDKKHIKYAKTITFLLAMMGQLFLFPQLFFPEIDPNDIHCGSEHLGISLTFWLIGGGVTVLIHSIYHSMKFFSKR